MIIHPVYTNIYPADAKTLGAEFAQRRDFEQQIDQQRKALIRTPNLPANVWARQGFLFVGTVAAETEDTKAMVGLAAEVFNQVAEEIGMPMDPLNFRNLRVPFNEWTFNVLLHAGNFGIGTIRLVFQKEDENSFRYGIEVVGFDQGPGIADLNHALEHPRHPQQGQGLRWAVKGPNESFVESRGTLWKANRDESNPSYTRIGESTITEGTKFTFLYWGERTIPKT